MTLPPIAGGSTEDMVVFLCLGERPFPLPAFWDPLAGSRRPRCGVSSRTLATHCLPTHDGLGGSSCWDCGICGWLTRVTQLKVFRTVTLILVALSPLTGLTPAARFYCAVPVPPGRSLTVALLWAQVTKPVACCQCRRNFGSVSGTTAAS